MSRLRIRTNPVEWIVVAAILAPLLFIILPAIEAARPYRPPTIPDTAPEEGYRVWLANGFSVVRPPYWEVTSGLDAESGDGAFVFWSPIANKPNARLQVNWTKHEPTRPPEARDVVFQGNPAWVTTERREASWSGRRGHFRALLTAVRGDQFITVDYSYFGEQSAVPDMMWTYFETVACPPAASSPTP